MTDKIKKDKQEKKAEKEPTLSRNIKHDGKFYKVGVKCPPELLKLFKDKGFVN